MEIKRNIPGDKALAYFLGWRIDNSFPDKDKVWRSPKNNLELESTFKFCSDWNWLMEARDAIDDLEDFSVVIRNNHCEINHAGEIYWTTSNHNELPGSTMEAVYLCFTKFAEIYNEAQIKRDI
jgi:hypothetical protein